MPVSFVLTDHVRFPSAHKRSVGRCGYKFGDLVGIGYDLKNKLLAIKVHTSLPAFAAVETDLDFRIPRKGNSYFSADLTRRDILGFDFENIDGSIGYKRILSDHLKVTEQFYVGPGYSYGGLNVCVAYAYRERQQTDG